MSRPVLAVPYIAEAADQRPLQMGKLLVDSHLLFEHLVTISGGGSGSSSGRVTVGENVGKGLGGDIIGE